MTEGNSVFATRWTSAWVFLLVLGLFLTFRGYRSLEGDQAYRLPLLFHQQNPEAFKADPFVRAFEEFNPHRGSLAVLDLASRPFGLMSGLAGLFLATFALTYFGVERLGRVVGPSPTTGVWAGALILLFAQAGNIGTNHLFEPILLDRLIALSFGWWAIALAIETPADFARRSCPLIGIAAMVHPSIGLQLAIVLGAASGLWWLTGLGPRMAPRSVAWTAIALATALLPGLALNLGQPGRLLEGLPVDEFRRLSAELQSPQHMLPHLWRTPQWLAWFCYPILAGLALFRGVAAFDEVVPHRPRNRLVILIAVNLAFLLASYIGIEVVGNLRLTVFQPFRMATLARGLCLILLAGHCQTLWSRGETLSRLRVLWLATGLLNDWSLVVVTVSETCFVFADICPRPRLARRSLGFGLLAFACGLVHLGRNDTESGHLALIAVTLAGVVVFRFPTSQPAAITLNRGRQVRWLAACWLIPLAALIANLTDVPSDVANTSKVKDWLIKRCRFAAVPNDDMERLAAWCRDHTPEDARFIGPPGPKSFRLWSKRSLAFNRAASPYHAKGLEDWSRRFMEHVGFDGTRSEFVEAYLRNRQDLERGYDRLTPRQLCELAERNEAEFIIAMAEEPSKANATSQLELVHAEGRYAVYRPTVVTHRADAIAAKTKDGLPRSRR